MAGLDELHIDGAAGERLQRVDALLESSLSPEDRAALMEELTELYRRCPSEEAADLLVRRFCDVGNFSAAAEYRSELNPRGKAWFDAVDALVCGDLPRARDSFERYLSREAEHRDAVAFASPDRWAFFYPAVLHALHSPSETVHRAVAAACDRAAILRGSRTWGALQLLQSPAPRDVEKLSSRRAAQYEQTLATATADTGSLPRAPSQDEDLFWALVYLAFVAYWFAPNAARKRISLYSSVASSLMGRGHAFFASELTACAASLEGRKSAAPHPLRDLIRRQPRWLSSIEQLESLAAEARGAAAKRRRPRRIAWLVDEGSGFAVTPVEQVQGESGAWSKGRPIAPGALAKALARASDLTEGERRVAGAVENRDNRLEIDHLKALVFLAGCPNVFRKDDRAQLQVIRGAPQVEVATVPGGCRLSLTPPNPGGRPRVASMESRSQLKVTEFTDNQIRIAAVLGAQGTFIPEVAKKRMTTLLAELAEIVTVQSQTASDENEIPTVDGDGRLHVQLSPCGEGLNVEFVVRPFGDGISCAPGKGGALLTGVKEDSSGRKRRVQARRDLPAESKKLDDAVVLCPALVEGTQIAGSLWQLSDPETCLEALLQLGKVPDLTIEWPRGGVMTVRGELDVSAMQGAVQSSGVDWFTLTGTVRVDSGLTFTLRQLIDLLHTTKSRFIPVGPKQFVALTREFQRRLEELDAFSSGQGDELKVPLPAVPTVATLFDTDALAGDRKWHELCSRFKEAQNLEPEVPSDLRVQLRPYQLEGYRWLARLAHCGAGACLADDMGLGKTIQSLALLLHRADGGPTLIVAPTSVCGNWLDEARRFAPTLNLVDYRAGEKDLPEDLGPSDVVLTSYTLLQNRSQQFDRTWHTIVLDEAQAIKNMTTKRSDAIMKLRGDFRVAMTGTPIENHLGELWNIFRFLAPGLLGTLASFTRRFTAPINDGDHRALDRLRKIISPFLLRRVKGDVLDDLPPHTEVTLRVDLSPAERAFYEALRQRAVEVVNAAGDSPDEQKRFTIFAQLMKLRRACCAASLADPTVGAGIPSSKLAAMLEKVEELKSNGHRILIFSQFTSHLALIRAALNNAGVSTLYLDGATPASARRELVAEFQRGGADCFLISLRAGGTGLNLTAADYVIHMDPWWNPAVEDQASDRAYRIGQRRPVTVYRLVARGTIEEKIVDLHRAKRELAQNILDGTRPTVDLETMASLISED